MLDELRRACDEEGRDFDTIEITTLWDPGAGEDALNALKKAGVSRVIVMPGSIEGINRISERYIA
jgi:hypothetical protein